MIDTIKEASEYSNWGEDEDDIAEFRKSGSIVSQKSFTPQKLIRYDR